MPKRRDKRVHLSNFEVSIIKGLIERGNYTNQVILKIINSTRRNKNYPDVNGGRISEIKTGHTLYPNVTPAADSVIDQFIYDAEAPPPRHVDDGIPSDIIDLKILLAVDSTNPNCLASFESDTLEYKQTFEGLNTLINCLPTIASLANNKGGHIIFGVRDSTREVVGICDKQFQKFDLAQLADVLRNCMSCDIPIEKHIHKIDHLTLGVLHVKQAAIRPVIAARDKGNLQSGRIYFRYSAQNGQIGSMELQDIIEDRVRNISTSSLSSLLSEILATGVENSAIYNMNTGIVTGPGGSFVIDESILPKISFIKEGNFSKSGGVPALKIIGDIESYRGVVRPVVREAIELYPYSWRELCAEVKRLVPSTTNTLVNKIIKQHSLKSNPNYSTYSFRNMKQKANYEKSGTLPSSIPSIYNQNAVDFVVKEAEVLHHTDATLQDV